MADQPSTPWREYAIAAAAVGLSTAACFAMFPWMELVNLVMVYLMATLLVSARGHLGPAVLSSALGVLCFDFFFVPPRYSLVVSDTQYIFTFLVMFAVAMTIARLTTHIRAQAEAAKRSEARTAAMHALARDLAATRGLEDVLRVSARRAAEVFDAGAVISMPKDRPDHLACAAWSDGAGPLDEKEMGVAQWAFDHGQPAGRGTGTLPDAVSEHVPLIGARGPAGVLSLVPRTPDRSLDFEQSRLLDSFANQIGLALEVDRLQEDARKASLESEKERLRSSLLSSVSHDLRTPLAGIIGSASSLLESGGSLSAKPARELLENIQTEGERMARLVQNLIETTRLESGAARLRKEPYSIEELLGSALERVEKLLGKRRVETMIPEDLPLVPLDGVLMEQALVNVIENACRHTPADAPIEISASASDGGVSIVIADHGPGLAPEETEKVFEKFYHAKSPAAGAGLGLAICRAIVSAHGGRIWAENRPEGGAVFLITLPMEEARARA